MARAELSRGAVLTDRNGRGVETVNIFDITYCPRSCILGRIGGNGRFECKLRNGSAVLWVYGGCTRETIAELSGVAECLQKK